MQQLFGQCYGQSVWEAEVNRAFRRDLGGQEHQMNKSRLTKSPAVETERETDAGLRVKSIRVLLTSYFQSMFFLGPGYG